MCIPNKICQSNWRVCEATSCLVGGFVVSCCLVLLWCTTSVFVLALLVVVMIKWWMSINAPLSFLILLRHNLFFFLLWLILFSSLFFQAYLHSMSIIHRDLNSHNCLIKLVRGFHPFHINLDQSLHLLGLAWGAHGLEKLTGFCQH